MSIRPGNLGCTVVDEGWVATELPIVTLVLAAAGAARPASMVMTMAKTSRMEILFLFFIRNSSLLNF
jgi:hypothetical protein